MCMFSWIYSENQRIVYTFFLRGGMNVVYGSLFSFMAFLVFFSDECYQFR